MYLGQDLQGVSSRIWNGLLQRDLVGSPVTFPTESASVVSLSRASFFPSPFFNNRDPNRRDFGRSILRRLKIDEGRVSMESRYVGCAKAAKRNGGNEERVA